jgi:hypothetical protein
MREKAPAGVSWGNGGRWGYRTRNGLRSVWLGLDIECGTLFAVQVNGKSVGHQSKPEKVDELPRVTK